MAILLDETTEVVVQGTTGKEGQFRRARDCQVIVIGPNSIGVVSPGKAIIGIIGGRFELMQTAFRPGPCGVLSRSGRQTTTLCYYLTKAGLGQRLEEPHFARRRDVHALILQPVPGPHLADHYVRW